MSRYFLGLSCLLCLTITGPAAAQNEQVEGLLKKGRELLDALPEVPADLQQEMFYKIESKETPIGWQHIKFDTVTEDGERFYRYRARYGLNGVTVGYQMGELMVIMDRRWKPVEIRNRMEQITPGGGKRDIKDRARIKNDKFQRRYFDGRQTKKFKFEYNDVNAIYIPDPIFGQLKLDAGNKFALMSYDVQRGEFDITLYEVADKKKDGMTKVKTYHVLSVEDPSKLDDTEFVINQDAWNQAEEEEKKSDLTEEEREARENYMLIDKDNSIRFVNVPRAGITVRRVDRERVEEIQKSLVIKDEQIPTT